MAAKKKQQLTIEEKMQQALVPQEEQPYKIPDNWCWVYIINGFAECLDKYRKPINANERAKRIGNIPYYGATGQVGWIDDYLTDDNLVLIGEDGAPFLDLLKDKAYIINGKAWVNNHAHILKSFYSIYGNKYLCYYLNIFDYKNYINGTTRLKLTQKNLELMYIPLPPLNEQQRIVNVIESLFAKLDEAKQLIQNTIDKFEQNKMAILHKAFTGELTEKWRKEKGILKNTWKRKKISEVCTVVRGGSPRPAGNPKFYGGDIPFMKVADITNNDKPYVNSTTCFIKEAGLSKTRMVEANTLLLTNSGATLGVPAICTFKTTFNDGIAAFLNLNPRSVKYYYYFFISKTAELRGINKGAAQPNLNTKIIGEITHNVPTIEEQQAIVNILDKIFSKYDKIKDLQAQIDKIELLKKSILAKAFRGKLGTNDPNEESAELLLREILAEK